MDLKGELLVHRLPCRNSTRFLEFSISTECRAFSSHLMLLNTCQSTDNALYSVHTPDHEKTCDAQFPKKRSKLVPSILGQRRLFGHDAGHLTHTPYITCKLAKAVIAKRRGWRGPAWNECRPGMDAFPSNLKGNSIISSCRECISISTWMVPLELYDHAVAENRAVKEGLMSDTTEEERKEVLDHSV